MAKKKINPIIEALKYIFLCFLVCIFGIVIFALWFVDFLGLFFGIAFDVIFFGAIIFWISKVYRKTKFLWLVYLILVSVLISAAGIYLDLGLRSQIPSMQDKPSYVKKIFG